MQSEPKIEDILQSHQRIRPYIHKTPLLKSKSINQLVGATIYFKCENFQKCGSFKIRGALNSILSLNKEQKQ